ncbi:hypothetical protein VTN96DRAFT_5579 [Rasamsonia emersonii]
MKFFERIERALQKHDRYDWAAKLQDFEFHFVSKKRKDDQRKWLRKQNEERRNGFALLQREIYLKEELAVLEKLQETQVLQPLTEEREESTREWQKELKTFDERYWHHKRAFYNGLLYRPKGPWIRYWDMSDHEFFYYSEKKILRCKANGGCSMSIHG